MPAPKASDLLRPGGSAVLPAALCLALLAALLLPFDERLAGAARALGAGPGPIGAAYRALLPLLLFVSAGNFLIPAALGAWAAGALLRETALRRAGSALSLALVGGNLASSALKRLLGRVRPDYGGHGEWLGPTLRAGADSFPSGHATHAFCLAWVLTRLHPRLGWAAWAFALLVGFQRVEGLRHYPSDVAAGALLGIVAGELALRALSRRSRP